MDKFLQHEALDRVFVQLDQVECSLGNHIVITDNPEYYSHYLTILTELNDLYQLIGADSITQEDK